MIDIDRKFQVDASDLRQMLQLAGEKATDQEVMKTNQIWTQNWSWQKLLSIAVSPLVSIFSPAFESFYFHEWGSSAIIERYYHTSLNNIVLIVAARDEKTNVAWLVLKRIMRRTRRVMRLWKWFDSSITTGVERSFAGRFFLSHIALLGWPHFSECSNHSGR